ncbi:MAG: polymer-forming cytoskeletal protein [Promethearchaeota archaeon]
MSTNDKELLDLLKKRFEEGEISEKVYAELKAKLEIPKTKKTRSAKKRITYSTNSEPINTQQFVKALQKGLEPLKNLGTKLSRAEETVDNIGQIISESLKPLENLGKVISESVGTALSSAFGTVHYDEELVKVMGGADIQDDVKTEKIVVAGAADFYGTVEANYIKIAGSSDFHKDVIVNDTMRVAGAADFHGDILGQGSVTLSGNSDVHGKIDIEGDLRITGSEGLHQSISAKAIYLTGSFECKGDICAKENIEIKISESTRIEGNIKGSTILIKPRRNRKSYLEVKDVIGENINITGVKCQNIQGNEVIVGPDCEIFGTVNYSSICEVDPAAKLHNPPIQKLIKKVQNTV